jgi:signal transduction histidine kinase
MSRLLPSSLFGRLVLTFVSGLVITMVVTLLAQMPERETFVFRISAGRGAQRVTDLVKLMDQLSPAGRERLAEIASTQGIRTQLDTPAPHLSASEPGSNAATFRELLAEGLGRERPVAVEVGSAELPPEPGTTQPHDGFAFNVTTRLADDGWVRFEFQEPRRLPRWPTRVLIGMLSFMAVMAVLSFVAVRWVTRPLHDLAEAANELGADLSRPPLRESGPREVRYAARAFNSMQERLSRYVRTRTAILTAMSHDLKTPITRLRLRAELLDQPEIREKFIRDLSEMEGMVSTTLGYMRGLDDREAVRPVDVASLLAALQADAEELGYKVSVRGEAHSPFPGKPEGLKRCLQNLLDNALRYAQDAELAVEDNAKALTLYVRDRGPGIPADQLDRVFEPFFRLESSRNRGTGGTGLGLSIARNIAQSMGGDISLRNREGGGLEAKLTLPRAQENSSQPKG